ncbi:hypothetical protein L6164_027722 [Bauhinia variegata]|uniref:Uncharacterized protein n=1 Tax=Bauhinia variegata TaxID=167791 RepID=A0ACB9LVD5_BAUVA|nr:hypothetical protein L6164_027722 [Bauhinia variegata]
MKLICRLNLSGRCNNGATEEELEEKRRAAVLIFSQWTKVLDIMDYYFSEKGYEVCRINGGVKLDERKRRICALQISRVYG